MLIITYLLYNIGMKKKKKQKKQLIKLIIIITLVFLCGFLTTQIDFEAFENLNINGTSLRHPTKKISLVMVGDGLIHSALYSDAYEDGTYNFYKKLELIKPIVQKYDLAYYNQESILGGTSLGLSTYPSFNSPQEFGDAMIDAGFNIVSLANNHTLDRGNKAIINSREYWNSKEGIMVNGSATSQEERDNIQIMEKNGISYAMLSYTTTTNGIRLFNDYCVNFYDKDKVHEEIQKVRSQVDVLMVAMHWGEEYYTGVRNEQKEIAEYLASEGVDIVIGAHPHVIEPAQYIGDTFVIYSLGNFISAQRTDEQLSGLMMSVEIEKTYNKELEKYETKVINPVAQFTYTYRNSNLKNYKVYPYTELTSEIFSNYKSMYETLSKRITSLDDRIQVLPLSKES